MSELHIQFAAVALHQAEGIKLATVAPVEKALEMTPVDFDKISEANAKPVQSNSWDICYPGAVGLLDCE